jgi:hypothetical protein
MYGHVPSHYPSYGRVRPPTPPPCRMCGSLGGWDRAGQPVTAAVTLAPGERTTCFACGGTGVEPTWLAAAFGRKEGSS